MGLRWTSGHRQNIEDRRHDPPAERSVADGVDGHRVSGDMSMNYPGDGVGAIIGEALFGDYEDAQVTPNAGMGVWLLRTAWDVANPPYLSVEASISKHQREWRAALGLTGGAHTNP